MSQAIRNMMEKSIADFRKAKSLRLVDLEKKLVEIEAEIETVKDAGDNIVAVFEKPEQAKYFLESGNYKDWYSTNYALFGGN